MLQSVQPVPCAAPAFLGDLSLPVPNPLPRLLAGEDLPSEDAEHLFERLVLGKLEPAEIAGMLIALRMKGETAEEMIGAARALSTAATVERPRSFRHCAAPAATVLDDQCRPTAFFAAAAACDRQARQSQRQLALRSAEARGVGRAARVAPAAARRSLDDSWLCLLFAPATPVMSLLAGPSAAVCATVITARPAQSARRVAELASPMLRFCAGSPSLVRDGGRKALVLPRGGPDEIALQAETRASDGDGAVEDPHHPEDAGCRARRERLTGAIHRDAARGGPC